MDEEGDEAKLRRFSDELSDRLVDAMPAWLQRETLRRAIDGGLVIDASTRLRIGQCSKAVAKDLGPRVRDVITADVDLAPDSPLAVLRDGVMPLNALLGELGVAAPPRDRMAAEMFPNDTYALGPASFVDIDPELQEGAIAWGAARAHVHMRRHADSRRGTDTPSGPAPVGSGAVSDRPPFDQILAAVSDVDGWMTDDQARLLYQRVSALGSGDRVVEIGSFRGRSVIVLAKAAADGVEIVAIDPHGGGDRGPQEIAPDQTLGDEDHRVFTANLASAGVSARVTHIRKMSREALGDVVGDIDMLYIDGAHRFGPARADIVAWGDKVGPGGTMLIHDSFSSIGVTAALMTTTFVGRGWRYVGRAQSMAEFRRAELAGRAGILDLLRQVAQLPWFVRNVVVKVLLTMKLAPLTRLLGHHGSDWPY